MIVRFSRNSGSVALAAVVAAAAMVGPAPAQVYNFDNVVMYANRDLFPGYNDIWGFVGNDGHEYVIQGLTTGTAWWDVDDPANPVMVAMIPGPASGWRDMFVIGNYAYVGNEASGGGIQIVDISVPSSPTLITTYTATVGNSHTIFGDASRDLLFVMGGSQNTVNGGVQILDVSNPTAPVEIGQWDNQYIHDLSVEGNILYACLISANRFRMIDTTNPAAPVNHGTALTISSTHSSWPLGDGVHVAECEEQTGGHLKILNVSVPSAVTVAATHNPAPSTSAHNPHVQGTQCVVSWYTRGTRIIDVSTPTAIAEIGFWDTYPDNDGSGFTGNWGTFPHFPSGLIASNDMKYGLFLLKYEPTAGILDGTVSSSAGGFLGGATAEFVDLNIVQTVGTNGAYKFSSFAGAGRKVRFSAFGHDPDSVVATVPSDGTVTTNVVLNKQPSGALQGTIVDGIIDTPIEGVEVTVDGTPLFTTTDSTGAYSFPDLPSGAYTVDFLRYGYRPERDLPVVVATSQTTTFDTQLAPGEFFADFSSTTSWSVVNVPTAGNPANATGEWEFGEPWGTFASGIPFQTELDHTLDPETQCAVTGNMITGGTGTDDVDSLTTHLLSPVYDLSSMVEPHLFYYRWYAVNANANAFEAAASSDGGSSWTLLESTTSHEAFWKPIDIDLTGLLASYATVQLRFTAQEGVTPHQIEAAVDDVTIYDAQGLPTASNVLPPSRLRLELAQSTPNPFAKTTDILFSLPQEQHTQLSVYDVRGARVATLVDAMLPAGYHTATWNGRTFTGERAASGVYFYKLQTKEEIRTRKLVRLD
ncbi:MAG: choice-of-anchor B family protein [Candidatus Eiseniibacteriota bacterium]